MKAEFYHIKNLQSTKTDGEIIKQIFGFIILRIYKVLKLSAKKRISAAVLSY